jgi:membrane associated rhomboid family serine protease
MQYRSSNFGLIPPVVKNLLIINVILFLATYFFRMRGTDLSQILGLFYFDSDYFRPWQILTHMFMHGSVMHIFFNMFAVWMFGSKLEMVWGPKRFLAYYLITGFGAMLLYSGVNYFQVQDAMKLLTAEQIAVVKSEGGALLNSGSNYVEAGMGKLNLLLHIPVVGASGALFGVLGGFAMLFPNTELMLIFFPIPIKAKYFVAIYGAAEIWMGIQNSPGDNVAHFAHVGGLIVGVLLVKYWNKTNRRSFF